MDSDRGIMFHGLLIGGVLNLLPGLTSLGPSTPGEDNEPPVSNPV